MGVLQYKFKLNFINVDDFAEIDTTETVQFDGASFILEQEAERYGRDVFYLNDKIDLFFYNGVYDLAENPLQLPNGTIINHLTQGFDHLYEAIKQKGYELECEFVIYNDTTQFAFGVLDIQNFETDDFSFIKCKVLQSTQKQIIKRRADFVVDMFSDKDADENPIDPIQTSNILLQAKPLVQNSKWTAPNYSYESQFFGSQASAQFPIFRNIIDSEIQDTLTSFFDVIDAPTGTDTAFFEGAREDLRFIVARNDLSNITLNIKDLSLTCPFFGSQVVTKRLSVVYGTGFAVGEFEFIDLFNSSDDIISISSQDYEINIPFVPNGGYITLLFSIFDTQTLPTVTPSSSGSFNVTGGEMTIDVTATAIDTVIKGARYIDVIKQTVKSISGLGVESHDIGVGGQFYDQFVFTGNLIKGRDDVAFPVKFKDIIQSIKEVNQGYQILNDKVYIGGFNDFYANNEIAVLPLYPDESYIRRFNSRFAINLLEYEYDTFEQDRDEENTSDSVHTETQWSIQNRQVENKKVIKNKQIRDYNKIETSRKEAIKTTTTTSSDDKLFLLDVISLAPSVRGGFTYPLTHNIDGDGNVQLLNDNFFSWSVLGFGLGSEFNILSIDNDGSYTVLEITDNIITLTPVAPATQSFTGESLTVIDFPYTNVQYTNRTNEGFDLVEGIISPDRSSNLNYTPKRNIKHWERYLANCVLYTNEILTNRYYKNNQFTEDGLTTRKQGETEDLNEKADLTLDNPILSPFEYDLNLVVDFDTMVSILNSLDTINEDNSIGGFIRCFDPDKKILKVYPKKLDYEPSTETLTITAEERFSSDVIQIYTSGNNVIIDDVPYDNVVTNFNWFEINAQYLVIFDSNNIPIINPTRYDKVSVNDVIYNNEVDLSQALIDL